MHNSLTFHNILLYFDESKKTLYHVDYSLGKTPVRFELTFSVLQTEAQPLYQGVKKLKARSGI